MAGRTLAIIAVVLWVASSAGAVVLYNGASGGTPDAQGWRYATDPLFVASATSSESGGVTTLDTTPARDDKAGYFSELPILGQHPLMPALDRTAGYVVRFDLQIVSEGHNVKDLNSDSVDDRGGFSVIALSSDGQGVEIAFWTDEVWAYDYRDVGGNFEFVHDEGSSGFDPSAAMTRYDLSVAGSVYTLEADGTEVLSGPLRDYSAEGWPYTTPSFLFFGDDTTSADSMTGLAFIEVIPEPGTLLLLGVGAVAMMRRRRP